MYPFTLQHLTSHFYSSKSQNLIFLRLLVIIISLGMRGIQIPLKMVSVFLHVKKMLHHLNITRLLTQNCQYFLFLLMYEHLLGMR